MLRKTFRITCNPKTQAKDKKNDIKINYIEEKFIENTRVVKFLLAKEYTKSEGLHYHGYIECSYAMASVRKLIQKMCKKQYKGNGFLSIKTDDVGEYWKNYICKDGDIIYKKGFTEKEIKEAIKKGKEYKEKKKLFTMSWKDRMFYYLNEKGHKDKLIKKFVTKHKFLIEKNLLPLILQISTDLDINPPPPHIYQQVRISVLRVLFPKAFRQWYITYIQDSLTYKGQSFIYNSDDPPTLVVEFAEDSETEEESSEDILEV